MSMPWLSSPTSDETLFLTVFSNTESLVACKTLLIYSQWPQGNFHCYSITRLCTAPSETEALLLVYRGIDEHGLVQPCIRQWLDMQKYDPHPTLHPSDAIPVGMIGSKPSTFQLRICCSGLGILDGLDHIASDSVPIFATIRASYICLIFEVGLA